jgi:hypothetical protein
MATYTYIHTHTANIITKYELRVNFKKNMYFNIQCVHLLSCNGIDRLIDRLSGCLKVRDSLKNNV